MSAIDAAEIRARLTMIEFTLGAILRRIINLENALQWAAEECELLERQAEASPPES